MTTPSLDALWAREGDARIAGRPWPGAFSSVGYGTPRWRNQLASARILLHGFDYDVVDTDGKRAVKIRPARSTTGMVR